MLQQPVVLPQSLGIAGPQLADGVVQEPPPFRRPRPDQGQVLWAEQHRLQHFRQGGGVFGLHLVDENPPPRPPEELQLYGKV